MIVHNIICIFIHMQVENGFVEKKYVTSIAETNKVTLQSNNY